MSIDFPDDLGQEEMPAEKIIKPRKRLGVQAREKLEHFIATGVLRPDQRLVEQDLAERLRLSRTPLREALHQLEVKGYVVKSPSSGYVVAYHTKDDIKDIFEVREILETRAMQLACTCIKQDQIGRATEYLDHEKDSLKSASAMWHWNDLFHDEMYSACGNKLLIFMIQNVRDKDRVINMARGFRDGDFPKIHEEHVQILEAVKRRDKRRAAMAVKRHLRMLLEVYLR